MSLFASLVTIFFALKYSVSLTEALVATNGLFTVIIGFTLSRISSKIIAEQHTKRIYFFRLVGAALILFGVFNILT
jgi:ABC-type Fe3+-siderophore transport system permease subunit